MSQVRREQAQILRLHDRTRALLQRARDDLTSPGIQKLLKQIRKRSGTTLESGLADVVRALEDAIRVVQVAESEAQQEMREHDAITEIDGIDNLPARLGRFLAERDQLPGFSYEVEQDEVRGWTIVWKEYTNDGRIRGSGQFYERPFAWLDD